MGCGDTRTKKTKVTTYASPCIVYIIWYMHIIFEVTNFPDCARFRSDTERSGYKEQKEAVRVIKSLRKSRRVNFTRFLREKIKTKCSYGEKLKEQAAIPERDVLKEEPSPGRYVCGYFHRT